MESGILYTAAKIVGWQIFDGATVGSQRGGR